MAETFDKADDLERLGIALLKGGKAKEAAEAFMLARDLFHRIHKAEPQNIEAEYRLASTLNNLATVHFSADRLDRAQSFFLQAFEIFRRLWAKNKNRPEFGKDLAATTNNLGRVLSSQDKKQEARAFFQQAQTIRDEVLTLHPNYNAILSGAATTAENLAALEKDSVSERTKKKVSTKAIGPKMNFATFCRTYGVGEPTSPQNTHSTTQVMCDAYRRFVENNINKFSRGIREDYKTNITVEFGFYTNDTRNAFVAKYDNLTYFIGINSGAVALAANVYGEIFSRSPKFLSRMRFGSGPRGDDPPSVAATIALNTAIHFLTAHLVGHIAYGHLAILSRRQPPAPKHWFMPWRAQTGMPAILVETTSLLQGPQDVPADLSQSIEVDADLYACSSVMMAVSRHSLCGSDLSKLIPERAHLLQLSTIAILTWFHMSCGSDASSIHLAKDASHPLPEVRLLKYLVRAHQIDNSISDKSSDPDILKLLNGITDVHVPQQLRGGFLPMFREQGSQALVVETERVRKNEDKYENELGQFSLIPVGGIIS